ncbi:MAG TPA: EamA family transporter [Anaerolineae bacterium]|nr:EamA family transporter [Anaerolineae bacterium]
MRIDPQDLTLLAVNILLNVAGQLAMKRGMTAVGVVALQLDRFAGTMGQALSNGYVLAGIAAYSVSAILWLVLLSRLPLSYVYPAISLGYVVVVLISWAVLREDIPPLRWLGVLAICIGVYLVGRS